jgi:hypothetical protein
VAYNVVKHIKIIQQGRKYQVAPDSRPFPSIQVRKISASTPRLIRLSLILSLTISLVQFKRVHGPAVLTSRTSLHTSSSTPSTAIFLAWTPPWPFPSVRPSQSRVGRWEGACVVWPPSPCRKIVGIGRARARFGYVAKSHDELSFDVSMALSCFLCSPPRMHRGLFACVLIPQRGVELVIISTQEADPGWWRGALPEGKVGQH